MSQLKKQEQALIEAIGKNCKTPAEASAKLKEMFPGMLENMLEAELDDHLGYLDVDKRALALQRVVAFPQRYPLLVFWAVGRLQLFFGNLS